MIFSRPESEKEDGFFVEKSDGLESIAGRIHGREYRLWHNTDANVVTFSDGRIEATLSYPDHALQNMIAVTPGGETEVLDMGVYLLMLTQLKGALNDEDCHAVNINYCSAH